ncbi:hypothetical protein D3C80_247320 [compost metagenome]
MGGVIKAAGAFRLDQLFLFAEGVFLDEDALQFRLRVACVFLHGGPAAAHGDNSHLQGFDLGNGIRLRFQLLKAFLKHVAAENQNALHGSRRLLLKNAAAALIAEKCQSPGRDRHQRQENREHFGGYGMKTVQHGRCSPQCRISSRAMHGWRHWTADMANILCCGSSCPQLPFFDFVENNAVRGLSRGKCCTANLINVVVLFTYRWQGRSRKDKVPHAKDDSNHRH